VESLLDFEGQTADANDFFTNAVQNPALDSFQRDVLPKISRQFGGADFFSSERQSSEGLARQDLLNSLTAQRSTVNLDQFNKSRDRALQAAGLLPALNQADATRTGEQTSILQALGLPRQIEQAGKDKAVAEDARLQELLSQLSLTPTIENIGMTNPGNAGLINIILGGAAQGLGGQLGDMDWMDLFDSLFGDNGPGETPAPEGESPVDGLPPNPTGTTVTDIPPVPTGGNYRVGPDGRVIITDANGNPVNSTPNNGTGVNIGPSNYGVGGALAGSIGAGLIGAGAAPAGTAIITEAGGALASQVGAGAAAGAGAAGGAGAGAAGAGAGAGAGGGATSALSGVGSALGAAAIGWAIADASNYALEHDDRRESIFQARTGMTPVQAPGFGKIPGGTYYILPNGRAIAQQDMSYLHRLSQDAHNKGEPYKTRYEEAMRGWLEGDWHSTRIRDRDRQWLIDQGYTI
jgi:hypothetical protein